MNPRRALGYLYLETGGYQFGHSKPPISKDLYRRAVESNRLLLQFPARPTAAALWSLAHMMKAEEFR